MPLAGLPDQHGSDVTSLTMLWINFLLMKLFHTAVAVSETEEQSGVAAPTLASAQTSGPPVRLLG
jgi:hypothetical protein